jgi:hypothetical protein
LKVTFGIGDINAQSSRLLFWSIGKIAEESFWDFQFLEISKFRKCRSEAIIRAAVSQSQFFSQDARESLEHEQRSSECSGAEHRTGQLWESPCPNTSHHTRPYPIAPHIYNPPQ